MKPILTLAGIHGRSAAVALIVLFGVGACADTEGDSSTDEPGRPTPVVAVAAEDTWGNLLGQIGGDKVSVTSIIREPGIDAHDYDPKPSDSKAVADARLVVVNGLGYDGWASNLIDANPSSQRVVVDVGQVVGAEPGDDPHRWYHPADVHRVVKEMAAQLARIDPANAEYYTSRSDILGTYDETVARIRAAHAGTPVAVSESIFVGMADALGLRVVTPPSFFDAIAEGGEPTVRDKEEVERQISQRQVELFVYNSQNATPDVRALVELAADAGVPVATVTETISPPGVSFQDWQVRQLVEVETALGTTPGP